MKRLFTDDEIDSMNWTIIEDEATIDLIKERSKERPQVIFKHSTRCSISSMAKNRLDRANAPHSIDFYILDLIAYRHLSSKIAEDFKVYHESPQVLVIKNGECVYDDSHNSISINDIISQAEFA